MTRDKSNLEVPKKKQRGTVRDNLIGIRILIAVLLVHLRTRTLEDHKKKNAMNTEGRRSIQSIKVAHPKTPEIGVQKEEKGP